MGKNIKMKKPTWWSEWNKEYSDLFDALKSEKHQKLLKDIIFRLSQYQSIYNYYEEQLLIRDKNYTYQNYKDKCVAALGWALLYMDYFHSDWFPKDDDQRKRVYSLCQKVKDSWFHKNKKKWRKLYEEIIEETENMC